MFSVSLWSLSNHLQNKVLPSIKNNKNIKITSILTKKKNKGKIDIKNLKYFFNKSDFLKKDKSRFVYISSINSLHYQNCLDTLNQKKNVICEKPICLNVNQLSKLIHIAKKNKVKIFEIIQYVEHPVFKKIKNIIKNKSFGKILYVESSFKVPLYKNEGFRFKAKQGGGALYDSGFYPISLLYTLFQSKKVKIINSHITNADGIDISGSVHCYNNQGINFNLSWGFRSNYQNYINILCEHASISTNLFFSKRIMQDAKIIINDKKKSKTISIKKSNQINLAFNKYMSATSALYKSKIQESLKILRFIKKLKN